MNKLQIIVTISGWLLIIAVIASYKLYVSVNTSNCFLFPKNIYLFRFYCKNDAT